MDDIGWSLVRFTLAVAAVQLCRAQELQEFCRWESMNASCPADHVIVMETARYGRMKLGRCLNRNYMIGCSGDVMRQADQRCSGRTDCVIPVPDETLHEVQPCPKDIMAYLEASYNCVPVVTAASRHCMNYPPLVVSSSSGYLANTVTETMSVGTSYCPWVLRVGVGQRLNVTLMDFNTLAYNPTSAICQVYATIKERSETRDVTVCAGGERLRHIMLSDSNELEVSIVTHRGQAQQAHFIIKYEAVGCADYRVPVGGWVQRQGQIMTVGCNGTSSRWHLVCKDNHWIGEVHNCTKGGGGTMWSLGARMNDGKTVPYGLLISVAIGVIFGIILGSLALTWVLMCRRWRRRSKDQKHPTHTATLLKPHPGKLPDIPSNVTVERVYAPTSANRVTSPGKNNNGGYAHIWELRQGMTGYDGDETYTTTENGRRVNLSDPGVYYSREEDPLRSGFSPEHEHVYESPKPTRREEEGDLSEGPYYHEFDADSNGHGRPSFDCPYPDQFHSRTLQDNQISLCADD